ncbi:RNA methyltransferase [Neisseria meningitidis]|uniref:TrmH family RNA methyltransferase n=1 Tax=Neisseria meningitidis TaxID=487 RepID=UPI000FCB1CF8|nr:RNA methyltransferase [Neisseria meningitidis]MCZ2266099.1 RNA methyltransferase [Neisseria meningitidis]
MKHISSTNNEHIRHLHRLLSQGKFRRQYAQTVLEGVHLLQVFLQSGGMPTEVYIPEGKMPSEEVRRLRAVVPEGKVFSVSDGILKKISSLTCADDVLALIDIPDAGALPAGGDCVVLDGVQDPGNVGTVLRSAAAAGVGTVVLGRGSADVWSPKVLRAGMGAHFLLDIYSQADLEIWLASYKGRVFATALREEKQAVLYGEDLCEPTAWVFGNEGAGVGKAVLDRADKCVRIPMHDATESLNVAMAATICLFEQMRQRAAY